MGNQVYFSDSLKDRLTEERLIDDLANVKTPAIKFKNSKNYLDISSIKISNNTVYISFVSEVNKTILNKENRLSSIIIDDEEINFSNKLKCNFYSYDESLNFKICTIVIDEEKFWSAIKDERHKNSN